MCLSISFVTFSFNPDWSDVSSSPGSQPMLSWYLGLCTRQYTVGVKKKTKNTFLRLFFSFQNLGHAYENQICYLVLICQSLIIWNFVLFLYKFIYFNWRLITLQYCIGFAIHQHECATGVHVFPILNSHLPPHTIPLGHPGAPAPSILYPALNLDWRFISYMILYMFQCHSPKSSHARPLPQSPKDCSIHLCLFCYLAYRVIVIIFLNSIYMC